MKTKILLITVFMASLVACASHDRPDYIKAENKTDYGYSETKISSNRYRVNYNGHTSMSNDAVKDMALLRAAELTLNQQYEWFKVADRNTEKESKPSTSTISTGISTGRTIYRECGLIGCRTTASPVYSSINVTTRPDRQSYSTSVEIVMGSGEVADQTSIYDAKELYAFLHQKYASEPQNK